MYRLCIVTSISVLTDPTIGFDLQLMNEELQKNNWLKNQSSSYHIKLNELVELSDKVQKISKIVNKLRLDYKEWYKKLLIMSFSSVVVFVISFISCSSLNSFFSVLIRLYPHFIKHWQIITCILILLQWLMKI